MVSGSEVWRVPAMIDDYVCMRLRICIACDNDACDGDARVDNQTATFDDRDAMSWLSVVVNEATNRSHR